MEGKRGRRTAGKKRDEARHGGSAARRSSQRPKELVWKIIVVGDLATGKTSLIKRYVHDVFTSNYRATIGVDFAIKQIQMSPSTMIRLQLWDIAGQERFGNMTRVFYRDAVAAVVVYDKMRPMTFEAVAKWKEDIDTKLNQPDLPCVLLANKCDLEGELSEENRREEDHRMQELCQRLNFCGWFNTSAKQSQGVEEAISHLVKEIMRVNGVDLNADTDTVSEEKLEAVNLEEPPKEASQPARKCC